MSPELQQIYWYSGVYLQPQHMQSLDLHHSYMLSRQRLLAKPWNVGIIRCDFNQDTLVDFTLKIDQLQVILPSGDYLEFPGNCMLQARQLRSLWKQLEKPFTLWLALRRFDPAHVNVGDSPNSRWLIPHGEEVMKDVYCAGPECSVSRILYNVQILSEEEKESAIDCEFLPLLRLYYDNDRVRVDPTYCPPTVTLAGVPVLKSLLSSVYAELANRAHQFAEYKHSEQAKSESRSDLFQVMAMHALNRTLPVLQHYCQTPSIHPWEIYGVLAQLIGELSSFNESCSFEGVWTCDDRTTSKDLTLLPYDHFNLYSCFTSARRLLTILLNNLMLEEHTWVTLIPDSQLIFGGDLSKLPWNSAGRILLLLNSETLIGTEDINGSEFKIAPPSMISALIQHSLPGITATLLSSAPRGVPNRKNSFYFELNRNDSLWKSIEQQQVVAFYWDGAPDDLQVQVIAIGAV